MGCCASHSAPLPHGTVVPANYSGLGTPSAPSAPPNYPTCPYLATFDSFVVALPVQAQEREMEMEREREREG